MATLNLADGESFVKGRSGAIARELIELAGDRAAEVLTTSYGYIVPTEILPEGFEGAITNADIPAVTTEPGTPTNVEDVFNKGGVRNAPVGTPLPEADDAPATLRHSVPDGKPLVVLPGSAAAEGEAAPADEEQDNGDNVTAFDPSKATVAEVEEYLAGADDDERARVIAAEKESDKPRKGVLDLAATPEEGK
jgi:hypothetical protein